jgi:hypothetical protein
MPINGVLDLQRRSVQIGEIRIGTSVAVEGKSYRKPVRLETFRFTTASEQAAHAVAELYGGEVVPWSQKKGRWEVVTKRTAIDVWVPPRGEAVDANMELWDGPCCLRRCDGLVMSVPGRQACMCPQPQNPADPASVTAARDERMRLAGLRPPQACKPLTRINVSITELPGLLGVWRLNTGSVNAAVETADSGEAMALAREGGKYIPAVLRIEWRQRSADGKPYPVPVLQIGLSMRDLAAGALPAGTGGLLSQLREPEQPKALTAGTPDLPGPETPYVRTGLPARGEHRAGEPDPEPWEQACALYDRAVATTGEQAFLAIVEEAKARGLEEEMACTDRGNEEWEQLLPALQDLWKKKAAA